MKLGEALTLRARQAQKLSELRGRVSTSALVQDGDTPPEDPSALLGEFETLSTAHADLIQRINEANVANGLLPLILKRDHVRRMIHVLRGAIQAATATPYAYSRTEVKWVKQIDVAQTQATIDALEIALNEVDATLQARNWEVEI